MKKGQVEMMGLVIIVILIVLGGLLFLRFSLSKPQIEQPSIDTAQSYNLINALLNIQICNGTSIRQATHACNTGQTMCNQDACTYTSTEIGQIIEKATYKETAFYALDGDFEVITVNPCQLGTTSPPYYFKEGNKEYEVYLKTCSA